VESVQHITHLVAGAFVDELARSGVHQVVVCPGSRSTPLAMLFAEHPAVKLWMHLDERSAAFFALGIAKQLREPVVVVCTSGTAAANFYPAIIEARYARVSLLVLTADRPPELQEVGASQTIDQWHLYGDRVKWFVQMPVAEANADLLRYVRTVAGRAAALVRSEPAGPVHVNFPFREPLVPLAGGELLPRADLATRQGRPNGEPYVSVPQSRRSLAPSAVRSLATEFSQIARGLIVVGPQDDLALARAVTALARHLAWPVLVDPLSLLRGGATEPELFVDAYDAFLRDHRIVDALAPICVLRFGAMPVSKPLLLFLQRHTASRQIVVDGGAGWNDPTLQAAEMIHSDPVMLCQALVDAFSTMPERRLPYRLGDLDVGAELSWSEQWRRINHRTRVAIDQFLASLEEPFEGKVFAELGDLLPDGATLYAGNSMPVRDLDTFFPIRERQIKLLGNRGASGIDGIVSSALGAAAVSRAPVVLVIGDLSFYHDLNGLLAAKLHDLSLTIVLLNNDGGGIFSFLPQADYPEQFEKLFGTPHGLEFSPVVEMYGGRFRQETTWAGFRAAVREGVAARGLSVIELKTERVRNVALHREVWRAVTAALANERIVMEA